MSPIVGPYAGVESDYRRERITASFREHKRTGRHFFPRRHRSGATPPPAVDWFGE
jgi:hypothetical protein